MESSRKNKKNVTTNPGKFISMILSNPAILNTITGYATTLTEKLVSRFSARYPKLITLMGQGLDSIEAKLKEHNSGKANSDSLPMNSTSAGTENINNNSTISH